MNKHCITIAAAIAVSALAITPAMARGVSQNVSTADLDLSTEAGARVLLERIDDAAQDVCRNHSGRMSVSERRLVRQCVAQTTEQSVAALDNPTVTAVYENKSPNLIVAQR